MDEKTLGYLLYVAIFVLLFGLGYWIITRVSKIEPKYKPEKNLGEKEKKEGEVLEVLGGLLILLVFLFLAYKFYTNFVKPTFSDLIDTYQINKTNKNEAERRCTGISNSGKTDFAAKKLYDSCMKKAGYWIY